MRDCDTCGGQVDAAHPFVVCPKCLFAGALAADVSPPPCGVADKVSPAAPPADFVRLLPRKDFFRKYGPMEQVDRGGQGVILKVWDYDLRRCVAMKRLGGDALKSRPALYRFLAEAQITSQLEHPGILPIFDVGLDPDDRPFYTTQLLRQGTTLKEIWKRTARRGVNEKVREGVELLARVCEVMAHAHNRGVIHRDLKPSNVMVGPFGDVRVIDWGSAHVLEGARRDFEESLVPLDRDAVQTDRGEALEAEPGSVLATAQSGLPVTVIFTPPEVLSGKGEPGPRTDIYSLGVMLYELLAGRAPYSNADGALPSPEVLRGQILQGPPMPVRTLDPSVSRDLAAICAKAMAHDPVDRYGGMQELFNDLRAALEIRPVQARGPSLLLILQKWAQRHAGYVALGGLAVMLATGAFAVSRGLKAQRDLARRVAEVNDALGKAELATRTGEWRAALDAWDKAEAAGYRDRVHLGLRRAEAWTVLAESDRAHAELTKLVKRTDLGDRRGAVLLRLGERELSLQATSQRGVQRVREALAAGLDGADLSFAKGLLAETTPQALELFRQTLQLNPFHHGAHTCSLGLEHMLGRHQELAEHLRVFKALFPDDSSGILVEASELAVEGNLAEAEARLELVGGTTDPAHLDRLRAGFRILAWTIRRYDIEAHLYEHTSDLAEDDQFLADIFSFLGNWDPSAGPPSFSGFRMPHLPCVQAGLHEALPALQALAFPFWGDLDSVVAKIHSSWQHHPEATIPMFAATFLDSRHPRAGPKSLFLLKIQAELFQLAADSPSVLSSLGRTALYRAAQSHFELANRQSTNADRNREACLGNIRRAVEIEHLSAAEGRAYFEMAFSLGNFDLAGDFLNPWELQKPGDADAFRARVRLELATGAFGNALELLDGRLAARPNDHWAIEQREHAVTRLRELLNSAQANPKPNP